MTRRPVVLHPEVEHDLAAAFGHYEQFDPALPDRFEARLDEQIERIEMYPESGSVLFEAYRRVLLSRFPYMVIYIVRQDRIDVLAVLNTRRDPARIEADVVERSERP